MKNKASIKIQSEHALDKKIRDQYIHVLTHGASKNLIEHHVQLNAHRILDYGCGQGIGTEMLQKYFPKTQIFAVDNDFDLMQEAPRIEHVEYMSLSNISTIRNESMDLVYSKLFSSRAKDLGNQMRLLNQKLSPGGLLLVEDIRFLESHCSPSNFVFQQGLELFAQLRKIRGIHARPLQLILDNLARNNYRIGQVIYHRPTFLIGEKRRILSLAIKSHADVLIKANLMSYDELKQFLRSLIMIESSEEYILTLPGIHQIIARKCE